MNDGRRGSVGFTLIEVMIVIAIIGVIASIAIDQFQRFQLKSKSAEGKINLAAIRTAQMSYYSEYDPFTAATPNPAVIPGSSKGVFDLANPGFATLGFSPTSNVYFSYSAAVSADGTGVTLEAAADLDDDLEPQILGYVQVDRTGTRVSPLQGCNVAALAENEVAPCSTSFGRSIF